MPGEQTLGVAFFLDVTLQDWVGVADAVGLAVEVHRRARYRDTAFSVIDAGIRHHTREVDGRIGADTAWIVRIFSGRDQEGLTLHIREREGIIHRRIEAVFGNWRFRK